MSPTTVFLHENFSDLITDPTQFDEGTPTSPAPFFAHDRPDLEQSAFAQDSHSPWQMDGRAPVCAGTTINFCSTRVPFSPRISVGRSLPSLNMVLHASFDRVFQTPSFENILHHQFAVDQPIDPSVLHLPVQPSRGNYYEGGLTQAFKNRMSFDVNFYRRDVRNYADDDQLLNTGVSYPIAFDKSVIYGAEAKLTLVRLGKLSGYCQLFLHGGAAWFPVTGGLFLGDDAVAALNQTTGHFPDSQDQRNTLRTRFHYRLAPRFGRRQVPIWIRPALRLQRRSSRPRWQNTDSR